MNSSPARRQDDSDSMRSGGSEGQLLHVAGGSPLPNDAAHSEHRADQGAREPSQQAAPRPAAPSNLGDELPLGVQQLVRLLSDELRGVRFPGFDAQALEAATSKLQSCAAAVASSEQAVARAREALQGERDEVLRLADKGLAYLLVYARDQRGLQEQIASIQLDPERAPSARRRKQRKPRAGARSSTSTVAEAKAVANDGQPAKDGDAAASNDATASATWTASAP